MAFQNALNFLSTACRKFGKVPSFNGIYEATRLQDRGVNESTPRFILGQQDSGLLARSVGEVVTALADIHQ